MMPMKIRMLTQAAIAIVTLGTSAYASQPLPGYQCLALNMTPAQAADQKLRAHGPSWSQ